jgi:DNA-binding MarR family transcriptional regulator
MSDNVIFMIRRAQLALHEFVFSKQKDLDLPLSQMTILRLIHTRPGLTQQRIADAMRIKKANLTPLINELVAEGLVARRHSAANRKAYALHLTGKGERSLKKTKKIVAKQMCAMADILDGDERDRLIQSLRKIVLSLPPRNREAKVPDPDTSSR